MIGYAMVGSSNLSRSTRFYDAIATPLGITQVETDESYVGYASSLSSSDIELYVTKPFNEQPASIGNGSMIAFKVESRSAVDSFHKAALEHGGVDEGAPGPRPVDGSIYYAYARDRDGNKLCAFCAEGT